MNQIEDIAIFFQTTILKNKTMATTIKPFLPIATQFLQLSSVCKPKNRTQQAVFFFVFWRILSCLLIFFQQLTGLKLSPAETLQLLQALSQEAKKHNEAHSVQAITFQVLRQMIESLHDQKGNCLVPIPQVRGDLAILVLLSGMERAGKRLLQFGQGLWQERENTLEKLRMQQVVDWSEKQGKLFNLQDRLDRKSSNLKKKEEAFLSRLKELEEKEEALNLKLSQCKQLEDCLVDQEQKESMEKIFFACVEEDGELTDFVMAYYGEKKDGLDLLDVCLDDGEKRVRATNFLFTRLGTFFDKLLTQSEEIERRRRRIAHIEQPYHDARARLDMATARCNEKLERLDKREEECKTREEECKKKEEECKRREEECKKKEEECKRREEECKRREEECQKRLDEVSQQKERVSKKEEDLGFRNSNLRSSEKEFAKREKDLTSKEQEMENQRASLLKLEEKIKVQSEINDCALKTLKKDTLRLDQQKEHFKAHMSVEREKMNERKTALIEPEKRLSISLQKIKDLEVSCEQAKERESTLKDTLEERIKQYKQLEAELEELKAQSTSSTAEFKEQNRKAMRYITQLEENNRSMHTSLNTKEIERSTFEKSFYQAMKQQVSLQEKLTEQLNEEDQLRHAYNNVNREKKALEIAYQSSLQDFNEAQYVKQELDQENKDMKENLERIREVLGELHDEYGLAITSHTKNYWSAENTAFIEKYKGNQRLFNEKERVPVLQQVVAVREIHTVWRKIYQSCIDEIELYKELYKSKKQSLDAAESALRSQEVMEVEIRRLQDIEDQVKVKETQLEELEARYNMIRRDEHRAHRRRVVELESKVQIAVIEGNGWKNKHEALVRNNDTLNKNAEHYMNLCQENNRSLFVERQAKEEAQEKERYVSAALERYKKMYMEEVEKCKDLMEVMAEIDERWCRQAEEPVKKTVLREQPSFAARVKAAAPPKKIWR